MRINFSIYENSLQRPSFNSRMAKLENLHAQQLRMKVYNFCLKYRKKIFWRGWTELLPKPHLHGYPIRGYVLPPHTFRSSFQ